ncbi:hypothetical protein ABFS83_05G083300 [Erythranthe nasuta]
MTDLKIIGNRYRSSSLFDEQELVGPSITDIRVIPVQEFTSNSLERDPGKRPQIWTYPVNQQDEIWCLYIKLGPYHFFFSKYAYQYSPTKDAAYCLPCYLFASKQVARFGANAFTVEGFGNQKKVNDGDTCFFLRHVGNHTSSHFISMKSCEDLMNQSRHIDKVMQRQSSVQILNNRLRLRTSIDCVCGLAYQSSSFRSHEEGPTSKNLGNFRERVKLLASYNDKVAATVLEKAPPNAKYISPIIQKEILHVIASKVRGKIQEDIGDSKFCILVDEARDDNMRGEWNGLQALFFKDCPYAYYVHCFAHQLQLALFFSKLDLIVNIVGASCKQNGKLITAQQAEISLELIRLLICNELEILIGGSHFSSVCSLIKILSATGTVLQNIVTDGANYSQRGDADSAYPTITSFQFIFILLLMKEIMGVTYVLCQALQQRSQDILNAMHLVSTTKHLLQKLRDSGWDTFLRDVNSFCESNEVEMPDMNSAYKVGRGNSIHQPGDTNITIEHHFHFDFFMNTIDTQLKELNCRFNEQTLELLTLSSALDPSDSYKSFKVDDICTLVDKYYLADFTEQERMLLKFQLNHYHLDMTKHEDLCHLSTLIAQCEGLTATKKAIVYFLVDRLIRLILLLPLTKTRHRNIMNDEFLGDSMLLHIEREIVDTFSTDSMIDELYSLKHRKAQF